MVRYFDPRKLILDQQEEEKKKVEDVLLTQERLDLIKEKEEAALRKKSNIREGLKAADKAVREFKFLKEDEDAYYDWKIKQDPGGTISTFLKIVVKFPSRIFPLSKNLFLSNSNCVSLE